MIPHGLNPHGLEDRTLMFNVLKNNIQQFMFQSNNRLYCWATFPETVKNYIAENFDVDTENVKFSSVLVDSQEEWDQVEKYVSKESDGNHFMVNGDQTFYYQVWEEEQQQSENIPEFLTVYVIDTSGSMNTPMYNGDLKDYEKVKRTITGEIYEYNNYVYSTSDSMIFAYTGTYLSNIKPNQSILGMLRFGESTLGDIYNSVSTFIDGVKKLNSSESMITNLYYSIIDIRQRMFEGEDSAKIGKKCKLTAASFILLTDESIFQPDSTKDVEQLTKSGNKWYSSWFYNWQTNATHKFPDYYPSTARRTQFCQEITDALKQMSYYYGVNFSWGMSEMLITNPDQYSNQEQNYSKNKDVCAAVMTGETAFWLNKVTEIDTNNGTISYHQREGYEGEGAWHVGNGFHVRYPHEPMCRIVLNIENEHISGENGALKDSITMKEEDQFYEDDVIRHFHKESNNEYCAFRFLSDSQDYVDKPIYLPAISAMNIVATDPVTGQPYSYLWKIQGVNVQASYGCGSTYELNKAHKTYDDIIVFKLVRV